MRTGEKMDTKTLREFGLVTGAIIAGLFGLLLPWLFDRAFALWPWIAGGGLALWGVILPDTLQPVYRGWMKFGHILGWINSRIILGIMFYLIILPIGLLMRLFRSDPMAREINRQCESYRVESRKPPKNHLERPF